MRDIADQAERAMWDGTAMGRPPSDLRLLCVHISPSVSNGEAFQAQFEAHFFDDGDSDEWVQPQ
jgi:hypothetical protein